MKHINVGFYSPAAEQNRSVRAAYPDLMVNPAPYYLHGYFKKNYPDLADRVHWAPTILIKSSTKEVVDYLNKYQIDVICISLYVWNIFQSLDMLNGLKESYGKPLKIVVGGPSCDAVKDEWETKYSFVDHFVVGQGEKAWSELVLGFLDVKELDSETANIVQFVKRGETIVEKKYQYEFVRGIHYSPYMECGDLVKELQAVYSNHVLVWPYETQRGCPYQCSFCDWNGGQSNKVQKRKEVNFLDEIDFFAKNNMINLHISDANFGMWDSDLESMRRIVEYKKQGIDFKFYSYNLSKIINNNFREIISLIVEWGVSPFYIKLSVQDTHDYVLRNIDRPGSWEEAKEVGIGLYKKFSESHGFNKIFCEMILGLPGQTPESIIENLDEFYGNGFVPRTYPFLLLRNAPISYDLEYRKLHGIVDDIAFELMDLTPMGDTVEEVYSRPQDNFLYPHVIESNSFTQRDYIKMSMIDQLYRRLFSRSHWKGYGFLDVNWQWIKSIPRMMINTSDFEWVLEQRYENFMKYRINAMNGSHGKIIVNGEDMCSIIARNFHLIEDELKGTDIPQEEKDKFFKVWRSYDKMAPYLNR
jgi:radical SAM superfamily enzyme YgiQ (UPF0313 family)